VSGMKSKRGGWDQSFTARGKKIKEYKRRILLKNENYYQFLQNEVSSLILKTVKLVLPIKLQAQRRNSVSNTFVKHSKYTVC
jgi:hypothetical protein